MRKVREKRERKSGSSEGGSSQKVRGQARTVAPGTPAGVSPLKEGDVLEATLEGVASMKLSVVPAATSAAGEEKE